MAVVRWTGSVRRAVRMRIQRVPYHGPVDTGRNDRCDRHRE